MSVGYPADFRECLVYLKVSRCVGRGFAGPSTILPSRSTTGKSSGESLSYSTPDGSNHQPLAVNTTDISAGKITSPDFATAAFGLVYLFFGCSSMLSPSLVVVLYHNAKMMVVYLVHFVFGDDVRAVRIILRIAYQFNAPSYLPGVNSSFTSDISHRSWP